MKGASWIASVAVSAWSGVFLLAAVGKAIDPSSTFETFKYLASKFQVGVTGGWLASLVGALAMCEFFLAAWLFSGKQQKRSLMAAGVVLASFTVVLAFLSFVGARVSCGCGVPVSYRPTEALIRNVVLLLCVGVGLIFCSATDGRSKPHVS